MGDRFSMSLSLAHELEIAFARHNWTYADVRALLDGDILAKTLQIIQEKAATEDDDFLKVWLTMIFGNRKLSRKKNVDLIVASVSQLGFKESVHAEALQARGFELGLQPCPVEINSTLNSLPCQSDGEELYVAAPIIGSNCNSSELEDMYLVEYTQIKIRPRIRNFVFGGRDWWYNKNCKIVFMRPRPTEEGK